MDRAVTFLAMTQKGRDVVRHVLGRDADMVAQVIIGRDPQLVDDFSAEIAADCAAAGVPFAYREEAPDMVTSHAIAISWRWLVDLGDTELIVMHDSILPRYRGFAPLPNMLINGEPEIGVTALFASAEYDCGDIIFQERSAIDYPLTIQRAIEINNRNYIALVDRILAYLRAGDPLPRAPQDDAQVSYSIWRDAADYQIDWTRSAEEISRFVDAVGPPYAGAVTIAGNDRVIVDAASALPDVACELRHPGKVIFIEQGCPVVICGQGLLRIERARIIDESGGEADFLPIRQFRTRFA